MILLLQVQKKQVYERQRFVNETLRIVHQILNSKNIKLLR